MGDWKMLNKFQPTEDKEYLCLAVSCHNNEIKHYLLLRYWQNHEDKFNPKGFIDSGGNNIIAWCEIPEPPKNISLYEVLSKYYE